MAIGSRYPTLARRWFALLVIVSVGLVIVTFTSYAFQGDGPTTRILFLIGLGGENNVGAWWSGMLLLLASVFAFDGYLNGEKPGAERRAWLALAVALFMLSFDEVASLHEFLANLGWRFLIPPALIGAGLVGYSVYQLIRSRVGWRIVALILAAFGLLATIPVQEVVQHSVVWDDPVIYGMRAFIEEGMELVAMLLLIFATRGNTAALLKTGDALGAAGHYRMPLIVSAAVLVPILTAATFVLPYPGGPADWLAAVIYLFCALHLTRRLLLGEGSFGAGAWLLLAFYLTGSALSNTVNVAWDPVIFGDRMSIRGLGVCLFLLLAAPILRMNGRRVRPLSFGVFTVVAFAASFRPESQLVWCAIPPLAALLIFASETRVHERRVGAVEQQLPAGDAALR